MLRFSRIKMWNNPTRVWEEIGQTSFNSERKRRETDLTLDYARIKTSTIPRTFYGIHHGTSQRMCGAEE